MTGTNKEDQDFAYHSSFRKALTSSHNDKDAESQRPDWDGALMCDFVPYRGFHGMLPLAHLLCKLFILLAHLECGRLRGSTSR